MKFKINILSAARRTHCLKWACVAALAAGAHASALFAVSGDPSNSYVPDQFSVVNTALHTVTTQAALGDGSLGFNGGLTAGPGGLLYAIANDSTGASSFYSVTNGGSTALIGSPDGLGLGFLGGLAYDSANGLFYAAVDDSMGNSSLYSITTGGVATAVGQILGTGFSGLAYDSHNGLLYGIGNDNTGFSTLYDFAPSPGGEVNLVGALGYGLGGLTYDSSLDIFWMIAGVNNAGSLLYQVSPSGAESNPIMTLGDGFAELAVGASSVPEPTGELAIGLAVILAAWILKRRKRITHASNKEALYRCVRSRWGRGDIDDV